MAEDGADLVDKRGAGRGGGLPLLFFSLPSFLARTSNGGGGPCQRVGDDVRQQEAGGAHVPAEDGEARLVQRDPGALALLRHRSSWCSAAADASAAAAASSAPLPPVGLVAAAAPDVGPDEATQPRRQPPPRRGPSREASGEDRPSAAGRREARRSAQDQLVLRVEEGGGDEPVRAGQGAQERVGGRGAAAAPSRRPRAFFFLFFGAFVPVRVLLLVHLRSGVRIGIVIVVVVFVGEFRCRSISTDELGGGVGPQDLLRRESGHVQRLHRVRDAQQAHQVAGEQAGGQEAADAGVGGSVVLDDGVADRK